MIAQERLAEHPTAAAEYALVELVHQASHASQEHAFLTHARLTALEKPVVRRTDVEEYALAALARLGNTAHRLELVFLTDAFRTA